MKVSTQLQPTHFESSNTSSGHLQAMDGTEFGARPREARTHRGLASGEGMQMKMMKMRHSLPPPISLSLCVSLSQLTALSSASVRNGK